MPRAGLILAGHDVRSDRVAFLAERNTRKMCPPAISRMEVALFPTTKRSKILSVTGAVSTTIIVAGLALAGYALLLTALNRPMGYPLLAALGVLEILLLVQVGIIVARLADGGHPAELPTLIGYLSATPLIPVAAGFWGWLDRSRWGPAVIAAAGIVAAVLMVRLNQIWPVIRA